MTQKPENLPAFPQLAVEACERDDHGDLIDPFTSIQGGMTLRDYFAAHAPISMKDAELTFASEGLQNFTHFQLFFRLAKMRLAYADAMLEARAA